MTKEIQVKYPPFEPGPHDLLYIQGVAFQVGFVRRRSIIFNSIHPNEPSREIEFEELHRLNADGEIRHLPEYFLHPEKRRPRYSENGAMHEVVTDPEEMERAEVRLAILKATDEQYKLGQVKITDESLNANMHLICETALPYLSKTMPRPEEALERVLRQTGDKREAPGGKISKKILGCHGATIRKWQRSYKKRGVAGLFDYRSKQGNHTSPFSPEESEFMLEEIRKAYLKIEEPTPTEAARFVRKAFRKKNKERAEQNLPDFRVPCAGTISDRIETLDRLTCLLARKGQEWVEKELRSVTAGLPVSRPLERVEIDECKIDLITILAETGARKLFSAEELEFLGLNGTKGRWWVVAAIDCRTRVILALKLTLEPKASAAVDCLRMVVSHKGDLSDAVGALEVWSQFGTPELVATDNGPAFKAAPFTNACLELGIFHQLTIPGLPGMRGRIERLFRTMGSGLVAMLSGRTFSNVLKRGDYDSEGNACLDVNDLSFALVRWAVDIYHNTPHFGLAGLTPLQQWEKDHAEGNYPLRAAPDARARCKAFGKPLQYKAQKSGITILGIRYNSPDLARWQLCYGPKKVEVRWDETNLGAIEVLFDEGWHAVPAFHDKFRGAHVQEWIQTRRSLKAQAAKRKSWDEHVVFEALTAIQEMNAARRLSFGLIDQAWTSERTKHVQDDLFSGFSIVPSSAADSQPQGGVGQIVVPVAPLDQSAPSPQPAAIDEAPKRERLRRVRSKTSFKFIKPEVN